MQNFIFDLFQPLGISFFNLSYKLISEYVFFPLSIHSHLIRTTVISFYVFHNLIGCLSLWAHRLCFTEKCLLNLSPHHSCFSAHMNKTFVTILILSLRFKNLSECTKLYRRVILRKWYPLSPRELIYSIPFFFQVIIYFISLINTFIWHGCIKLVEKW